MTRDELYFEAELFSGLNQEGGKGFAHNAGDPGSVSGSGSSPGKGIGYPLQCFGASLVAQMVENPPAMWETWG